MNQPPNSPELVPSDPPPTSPEDLLAELESTLRRHLDNPPAADDACRAADEITRLLTDLGDVLAQLAPDQAESCADRLRLIRDLHARLGLRLAQQRQELAERLGQLRKAKTTLRAYSANQ